MKVILILHPDFVHSLQALYQDPHYLNDVTLADVAANQNAVNKVKTVNSNTSNSGISAFIFGNSLVGVFNATNADDGQ